MTAFDNIPKAKAIWSLVLPAFTPPDDPTFHRWMYLFSIEDFETACLRLCRWSGSSGRLHKTLKALMYDLRAERQQKQKQGGKQ